MSVTEKIQKLLNHAASARKIGSVEEAAAFAAKAQELMMRHAVSVADVSAFGEVDDTVVANVIEPIDLGVSGTGRRSEWRQDLAGVVAVGHFCRITVFIGSAKIGFVGTKDDAAIAREVFLTLLYVCEKTRRSDYRTAKRLKYNTSGFSASYRSGFTDAIAIKMADGRATLVTELSETALAVIDSKREKTAEYLKRKPRAGGLTNTFRGNVAGALMGYNAGQSADTAPSSVLRLEAE